MPQIIQLRDKQIDAQLTQLFMLYDADGVTELAEISWMGKSGVNYVYTPCIIARKAGVNIAYDGTILGQASDYTDGTPTIAPANGWYTGQGDNNGASFKNLPAGTAIKFAVPQDPLGHDPDFQAYRSLFSDNAAFRLNNLNVFNDETMTGSCCDLRIGLHFNSTGKRLLIAQAAIDVLPVV